MSEIMFDGLMLDLSLLHSGRSRWRVGMPCLGSLFGSLVPWVVSWDLGRET